MPSYCKICGILLRIIYFTVVVVVVVFVIFVVSCWYCCFCFLYIVPVEFVVDVVV